MEAIIHTEPNLIRVQELLGEGLSSRVFAALREDSRGFSSQPVVLKILKPESEVQWMKREFSALSKIKSHHCVRILGWENLREGPALVLERIEGFTLYEIARFQDLSDIACKEIIRQARLGLKDVHDQGLFHGDISPSNLMIDESGRVRWIDFAFVANHGRLIRGTPAYLSPQAWKGETPTPNSDLFGLFLLQQDLQSRFANVPDSVLSCQQRADVCFRSQEFDQFLRSPQKSIWSPAQAQAELVSVVKSYRSFLNSKLLKTAVIEAAGSQTNQSHADVASNLSSKFRVRPVELVLSLALFCFPSADFGWTTGELEVRTHQWTQIKLNGENYGFAPLQVKGLRQGRHLIEYRNAKGRGEVWIQVESGRAVIQDQHLAPTRQPPLSRKD